MIKHLPDNVSVEGQLFCMKAMVFGSIEQDLSARSQ